MPDQPKTKKEKADKPKKDKKEKKEKEAVVQPLITPKIDVPEEEKKPELSPE